MAISPEQRDFSLPIVFDLAKELPDKTIDIGRNGTSVSSDPWGSVSLASVLSFYVKTMTDYYQTIGPPA